MTSHIGRIINRKYRLTRLIGEGGMGSVFEAEHTLINRRAAIKIMNPEFTSNREVIERFLREAQASSSIGHPNIIEIEDVGREADGTVYIVMELLTGQNLGDLLDQKQKLPAGQAVSIILQVLSALKAAHEKGVIHRDLKPDNLFLSTDKHGRKEVKLLDFGIAKVQGALDGDQGLTKTGTVLGTPNYMSPEQARGKPVDHRIDIWAVGVILYEMLSGTRPYTGESYNEVLSGILLETPRPIGELTGADAIDLIPIVEKAMKKDRDERYQSVQEMIDDLRPFTGLALQDENLLDATQKAIRSSMAPPPPDTDASSAIKDATTTEVTTTETTTTAPVDTKPVKQRKGIGAPVIALIVVAASVAGFFAWLQHSGQTVADSFDAVVEFWDTRILHTVTPPAPAQPVKEPGPPPVVEAPPPEPATAPTPDSDSEAKLDSDSGTAPLPDEVTIELIGIPKAARITVDGKKVKNPFALPGSITPVSLQITALRFKPFAQELIPDRSQTIEVTLEKKGRARRH